MFDVGINSTAAETLRSPVLVWSGRTLFREVAFLPPDLNTPWRRMLLAKSRRALAAQLDFRGDPRIGRRLRIAGPVGVRDYGRPAAAPHLAFLDITYRIVDLPKTLSNQGIDAWSPFMRMEYVVDTRTGRSIYQSSANVGGVADRAMRLFKASDGPLLMAVMLPCSDGEEPFIMDVEHESYGTGGKHDVPESMHCFPAL